MKHFLSKALVAVLLSVGSYAQTKYAATSQFLRPAKSAVPGLASNAASAKAYDFSSMDAKSIFFAPEKNLVLSNFPVSLTEQGTLELREGNSVFGEETHAWMTSNGKRVEIPLPASRCFKGGIKGEYGSHVFLVITGNDMYTSIERASGIMYQVAPSTTKNNTVLLMDNTHGPAPSFSCGFENLPEAHIMPDSKELSGSSKGIHVQSTELLEAKVAVETDRFLWARMGKDQTKITKYLYTIFATVSWIYERETNVCMKLGDLIIHNDEDPDVYTQNALGDIGELLREFTDEWQQNYKGVSRNVAVLFTVPGKTDVGGIAWLDGLCRSNGFATCGIRTNSALPTQNYQWDSFVTAHELGHTFSAPHTHACFWAPPIDTCVSTTGNPPIADACTNGKAKANKGSIMSYCHLIIGENPGPRYTFLPQVAAKVRNGAEKNSCLKAPASAIIKVTQPIGGADQIVRADTGVTIEWTSSKVTTVNIEFSLDGGSSFTSIAGATNLPATDRTYKWIPSPGTASTKAMIRIYDPSAPSIADTSYTTFTLGSASLAFQGWTGGERIGRKTTETIAWDRTFLSTNTLEFSATGSEPWTAITAEISAKTYSWKVPDIEASAARLRLVGAGGAVVATSGPFAIGTPVITILKPTELDSACSGRKKIITWQSDFVRYVDIKYSRNNGASFPLSQVISASTEAGVGSFIWNVPTGRESDSVVIRFSNLSDPAQLVTSSRFSIRACSIDMSVRESAEMNGLRIARIYPTPANDYLQLQIENSRSIPSSSELQVISNDGRVVLSQLQVLDLGAQVLKVPLQNISSGSYIVVLRTDGVELSLPFVIAH